MKTYNTLNEIVAYIQNKHPSISSVPGGGVNGWKLLRQPDGTRIPVEAMEGFKIVKFEIHNENTLIITQLASGYTFKGGYKHTQSSTLFLRDLVVVNVHDHCAEFLSSSSIDFSYVINNHDAKVQMLHEWIHADPSTVRASWHHRDKNVERILDEISCGRKVAIRRQSKRRHINMDLEDF